MSPEPMGRVEAIWIKPGHREPMEPVPSATLSTEDGIEGDANRGARQMTIVDRAAWERATAELGVPVDPTARRANLLVNGIDLIECTGQIIRIGACRVEMYGETKPCGRMDEAEPGLMKALEPEWRGGAYGVVLKGGEIRIGDRVHWE